MTERIDHVVDRAGWDAGPWDNEGDYYSWTDEATGIPCLVVRSEAWGSLCGYAGVEPGHPWYGLDYCGEDDAAPDVHVHGGLSYANKCMEDGPVCHVPEPGKTADVWWFGFDTGHAWDVSPGADARNRQYGLTTYDHQSYKDLDFVKEQVTSLAHQLAEAASTT